MFPQFRQLALKGYPAQQVWCKDLRVGVSAGVPDAVELSHEFAVGGACGGQFLVSFIELQPQVDCLLFEEDDALLELFDVGRCAES